MLHSCLDCGRTKHLKSGSAGEECFDCGGPMGQRGISLNGQVFDLFKIKEEIERVTTQSELAQKIGYADSTPVSRQLRGLRQAQQQLKDGILDTLILTDDMLLDEENPDDYVPTGNQSSKKTVDLSSFPKDEARELARRTIAAVEEGSLEGTFGGRRLKLWQRAFICLKAAGYSEQEALGGGYWLAHGYKLPDECQELAGEIFQRIFAFDAEHPEDFINHRNDQHPSEAVAGILLDGGFHIFAYGETGDGKSFGVERQARRVSNHPDGKIAVVSGHEALSTEHVIASGAARGDGKGGTETFTDKRIVSLSAEENFPLVMDEPSVVRPGILMVLQRLLEDGRYLLPETGEEIVADPSWTVILTDNDPGLGQSHRYNTRHPLDEAFRDRFLFIKWGPMPEALQDHMLDSDAENYRRFLEEGGEVEVQVEREDKTEPSAQSQNEEIDEEIDQFLQFLQ